MWIYGSVIYCLFLFKGCRDANLSCDLWSSCTLLSEDTYKIKNIKIRNHHTPYRTNDTPARKQRNVPECSLTKTQAQQMQKDWDDHHLGAVAGWLYKNQGFFLHVWWMWKSSLLSRHLLVRFQNGRVRVFCLAHWRSITLSAPTEDCASSIPSIHPSISGGGSSPLRAGRGACVLASVSPSPPFRNTQLRREPWSTLLRPSLHPSIHAPHPITPGDLSIRGVERGRDRERGREGDRESTHHHSHAALRTRGQSLLVIQHQPSCVNPDSPAAYSLPLL